MKGWHSRGFLPHFDGGEILQFISLHLGDAMPLQVLRQWQVELEHESDEARKKELYWRVEKYLDQGHGECRLGINEISDMVQESLLHFDGQRYKLIFVGYNAESYPFSFEANGRIRSRRHNALNKILHCVESEQDAWQNWEILAGGLF